MKPFRTLSVAGAVGILILSGCSSTKSSSGAPAPSTTGAASSATSSAAASSGAPIKVETIADADVGGVATAPYTDGFNAWVTQFNAAGGIGGRKIQTSFCDSKSSPANTSQCMQQVPSDAVALVGGLSLVDVTAIAPAAKQAGLLYMPSFTTGLQDMSMPNSLDVDGATVGWLSGATSYLVSHLGKKSVALIRTDVPGTSQNGALVQSTVAKVGGKLVDNIAEPLTATDYLPAITQAVSDGANFVIANLGSDGTSALASAVVSGGFTKNVTLLVSDSQQALPKVLAAAQAGVPIYSFDSYVISEPNGAGHANMVAAAAASGNANAWQDFRWLTGYMAGSTFGVILKSVGSDITRASVLKAAQTGTFNVPGITEPVSLTNAPSAYPALATSSIYITKIPGQVIAGPVPTFAG